MFDSVRYLQDQLDVTRARGVRSAHGVGVEVLARAYGDARARLDTSLAAVQADGLDSADRRALERMRRVFRRSLRPDRGVPTATGGETEARCGPTTAGTLDAVTSVVFACYGDAAERIVVGPDTLDRLSILGLLGSTGDAERRERLFRALDPVWRSVNGDDGPASPYRRMVGLRRAAWAGGETPMTRRALAFGISGADAERWLVRALEAWREVVPDSLVEPWDYYYRSGAASRALSERVPRDSLLALTRRFYRSLGADPESLGIRYDILPRAGKYPIAYTTFGARAVEREGRWVRAEPWVFASYRLGGLDNLSELLHETGHGIHIAAIRTRPAWNDWPDSDTFTEGIADLASLELYEPAWQIAWLGDSVPLAASLRGKYGGIMLDMAWALFEIRVHREGAPSPNTVWTDITRRYLGLRPHPELSWWAMRGQLVESPGYMLNYAVGAFLVADVRAAIVERYGSFAAGSPAWYRRVSEGIYRFGREQPAREVTEAFLGRPAGPEALLADLARIRSPARRRTGRAPR